jgi:TatD DNase family protein
MASLVPPIIDTHTHLDDEAFRTDQDAVIEAARAVGVRRFINIGYSPETWASSRSLQYRHSGVDLALGLHPQQADRFTPELARDLTRAIRDCGAIAVGEIGFDFSRSGPSFQEQERAIRGQLEIASWEGLPTIIHQRDAERALTTELDNWPTLAPIVLHSFDGTSHLSAWAIERGCYIGIGGLAARRSSNDLRSLLTMIPIDRLLLETDSPYLAPPSADRRNTPANLPIIATLLAPLWNLSGEDLCQATFANAIDLFGLTEVDSMAAATTDDRRP